MSITVQASQIGGEDRDLSFDDNAKAKFGAGDDLQIYHDGNNSHIREAGTGQLYIRAYDGINLQTTAGENYFTGAADGASTMYHNNNAKLATTSTGIDVTGTVTADNVGIGTSSPAHKLHLHESTSGSNYLLVTNSTTGSNSNDGLVIGLAADESALIYHQESSAIRFGTASTERMRIDSNGDVMVGKTTSDNTNAGIKLDSSGYASFVIANDYPIIANRLSSDGDIAVFRKDGSTVGSIGAYGGDVYIGTGDAGLWFQDGGNAIRPFRVDTQVGHDASIDLGHSSNRFKDDTL